MRVSARQRDILIFIKGEIDRTELAPTDEEIASKFRIGIMLATNLVITLIINRCLWWTTATTENYQDVRLTDVGLEAIRLPAKPDTKRLLEAILEAWEAPTGPGWADALEAAIHAGRDETESEAGVEVKVVQVPEEIREGNFRSIDTDH